MNLVSRGFRGRRRDADANPARVPPGQYVTHDVRSTPPFSMETPLLGQVRKP